MGDGVGGEFGDEVLRGAVRIAAVRVPRAASCCAVRRLARRALQTEDYARAVFSKRRPFLNEEAIERRVADRLSRQQVFERRPAPVVSHVLEEVLLDRPIGGRSVHAEQLRHLLRVAGMQNVEI